MSLCFLIYKNEQVSQDEPCPPSQESPTATLSNQSKCRLGQFLMRTLKHLILYLNLITSVLKFYNDMLWVGFQSSAFAGQSTCPFNLKTYALWFGETFLYCFFHNFLFSVFSVLLIKNSYQSDAEPFRLILYIFYHSFTFSVFLHFCSTFQLHSEFVLQYLPRFPQPHFPTVLFNFILAIIL